MRAKLINEKGGLEILVNKSDNGKESRLRVIRVEKQKTIVIHTVHLEDGTIEHLDIKVDGKKIHKEQYKNGKLISREENKP